MKIMVRAKPGSKKPGIEKSAELWVVRIRERPVEGQANEAIIAALSEELGIARSKIQILRGDRSKEKLVEILLD